MTLPEVLLWTRLRGAKAGAKFRRQHPIGLHVTDFYCASARLVLEVDGFAHDSPNNAIADATRDRFMRDNGLRMIRLPAFDILHDPDAVAASIAALVSNPLHRPADGPPPRAGEDAEEASSC